MLTLGVLFSGAYAVGRIHQWHKHGIERDEAYSTGYEKASRSIMGMMADQRPPDSRPREHWLPILPRQSPAFRSEGDFRDA